MTSKLQVVGQKLLRSTKKGLGVFISDQLLLHEQLSICIPEDKERQCG